MINFICILFFLKYILFKRIKRNKWNLIFNLIFKESSKIYLNKNIFSDEMIKTNIF